MDVDEDEDVEQHLLPPSGLDGNLKRGSERERGEVAKNFETIHLMPRSSQIQQDDGRVCCFFLIPRQRNFRKTDLTWIWIAMQVNPDTRPVNTYKRAPLAVLEGFSWARGLQLRDWLLSHPMPSLPPFRLPPFNRAIFSSRSNQPLARPNIPSAPQLSRLNKSSARPEIPSAPQSSHIISMSNDPISNSDTTSDTGYINAEPTVQPRGNWVTPAVCT